MTRAGHDDVALSVEGVSKTYEALAPTAAHRFFARFRGLQLETIPGMLANNNDDDDDDDFLEDDEDVEAPSRVAPARTAVDHVSFEARRGTSLAIVGPEGSGKTVLLKLIAGLVPPTSGRVVVRGTVAPALTALTRFPKGHTLQSGLLHVAAVAGLSPRLVRSRLDEIEELLGEPGIRRMPSATIENLRRGEALLATMLVVEPDVLVTDVKIKQTPTGERCLARIEELRRRRGLLLVAESRDRADSAPVPERVLSIDRGRIVADEPARAPAR